MESFKTEHLTFNVDSSWIVEITIILSYTNANCTLAAKVARRVKANITETLHDKGLSLPASFLANHVHVLFGLEENVGGVENTTTSG